MKKSSKQLKEYKNKFEINKTLQIISLISYNKEINLTQIAIKTQTTFSHVCDIINFLKSKRVISVKIIGRTKLVKLTYKGDLIANSINELKYKLKIKDFN